MIALRHLVPVVMLAATAGTLLSATIITVIIIHHKSILDNDDQLRNLSDRIFLASIALVLFMLAATVAAIGCTQQKADTDTSEEKLA